MPEEKNQESKTPSSEELRALLLKCEKTRDEYLDGWKRAKADFINYKKDEIKRFEELAKFSNEALLRDLIAILDSFDLGLTILGKESAAQKGFFLIKTQMEDLLKGYGLEKISVAKGDVFNPKIHEAVSEVSGDSPPGTVVEEVEKGYMLNFKVIRPSRVKVSKLNQTTNN